MESFPVSLREWTIRCWPWILNLNSILFSEHSLIFDVRFDLALDDFLLLLHRMFEKFELTTDCQNSKSEAELVLSLGPEEAFWVGISFSTISIPTDSKWPNETAVWEERIHYFRILLIFPEPLPLWSGCPVWVVALIPEGEERLVLTRPRSQFETSVGLGNIRPDVCLSHNQWARAVLLTLCLVCPAALGGGVSAQEESFCTLSSISFPF